MAVRPAKVCGTLPIGIMENKPLDFSSLEKDLPTEQTKEPDAMFQGNDVPNVAGSDEPDLLSLEKQTHLEADAALATLSGTESRSSDEIQLSKGHGKCTGAVCSLAKPASFPNAGSEFPSAPVKQRPVSLLRTQDTALPEEARGDTPIPGATKTIESFSGAPNIRIERRPTEIVNNFAQLKIVDYLKTGLYKKVLIRFHHGLGDTVLFYASGGIDLLRSMFPDIEIAFHTALGQEEIFGNVDNDATHYDIVFEPRMPISEWDNIDWNKAEKCLHVEFGIPVEFGRSVWKLPREYGNRLIGFHFHSTCMKNLTVKEASALKVWQYVQNRGFVALSTHMRHKNNRTTLYRFESSNVIDEPARVSKLFGLIKACAGFAGTASGNFHSALALLPPEKILFLKTDFDVKRITHLPIRQLDVRDANKIDFSIVDRWLEQVVRY